MSEAQLCLPGANRAKRDKADKSGFPNPHVLLIPQTSVKSPKRPGSSMFRASTSASSVTWMKVFLTSGLLWEVGFAIGSDQKLFTGTFSPDSRITWSIDQHRFDLVAWEFPSYPGETLILTYTYRIYISILLLTIIYRYHSSLLILATFTWVYSFTHCSSHSYHSYHSYQY